MTGDWHLPLVITGGGVIGLGLAMLAFELLPTAPALGPALKRLHQQPAAAGRIGVASASAASGFGRYLRVPHRDLALLGKTAEQYTSTILLSGLIGLLLPPLCVFVVSMIGLSLPFVVPVAGGIASAILFMVIAHRDVIAKADKARGEFLRAICTYLDLVSLQLAAAHGPVQSLEQAARLCEGWVFDRIRGALARAQMQMRSPWQELRELAEEIGIPQLGDVGAIMQASGSEGAQVHQTLLEQAASLRNQLRTDALARAEAVTGRLDIPGAALVFVLVLFVIYPFVVRV